MTTTESAIDVDLPIDVVYNQWTQFEEFPRFMDGIEEVRQVDDTHLHWVARIAGAEREWDAEITEQHPDERVAWRSTEGVENGGVVTFHRLAERRTRVMLQLEFDPEGVVEQVGDKFGIVRARARDDLARFKEFVEARGRETGAWRGDVERAPAGERSTESPIPPV